MLEPESQQKLKTQIANQVVEDRALIDELRREVRPLQTDVRRIFPRTTTAISLVGTDGGNNAIPFDPFLIQLIRVVDSSDNEYCLEVVSPTMSVSAINERQFDGTGGATTALGQLMAYLGVRDVADITAMIRREDDGRPRSPSWVQVYRELVEWAILFSILRNKDFGTDTILVFDGLLRSKIFAGDLFKKYLDGLREAIEDQQRRTRRRIYLAGVAKHSKVLSRYRLAMSLERILTTDYAAYVEIPREMEEKAYVWSEYARGNDWEKDSGEINKFVGGKMFFAKFGNRPRDPMWPIDVFLPQVNDAPTILGCMLADALNGFPVPLYPRCLQRAHENAALVDFDFVVLQDQIFDAIRQILGTDSPALDAFRLQDPDPAQARYS